MRVLTSDQYVGKNLFHKMKITKKPELKYKCISDQAKTFIEGGAHFIFERLKAMGAASLLFNKFLYRQQLIIIIRGFDKI